MSEYTGAVYRPLSDEFPMLAIIFKDGELLTWREIISAEEGDRLIAEALATLPTLE